MSEVRDEIRERVIAILAEQASRDPAEIMPGATLSELGIDSLGLMEAIFAIEETFDVEVPFNANEPEASEFDISSVGAIVSAVEALVARRA